MNAAELQFLASLDQQRQELRTDVDRLVEKAGDLINMGEQSVWAKIEKGASRLVEKSSTPISDAQAVANFLRTEDGQRLYVEYQRACDDRRSVLAKSAEAVAERDLVAWAHDRFSETVSKAQAAGMTSADAVAYARERHPAEAQIVEKAFA